MPAPDHFLFFFAFAFKQNPRGGNHNRDKHERSEKYHHHECVTALARGRVGRPKVPRLN
jgi:hypothetical protein